ncbi:hypothetical protein GCM10008941_33540 [Rhizomicrobium palustre]
MIGFGCPKTATEIGRVLAKSSGRVKANLSPPPCGEVDLRSIAKQIGWGCEPAPRPDRLRLSDLPARGGESE